MYVPRQTRILPTPTYGLLSSRTHLAQTGTQWPAPTWDTTARSLSCLHRRQLPTPLVSLPTLHPRKSFNWWCLIWRLILGVKAL
jgi:hypothetical protein